MRVSIVVNERYAVQVENEVAVPGREWNAAN
jgi:hypothetical protein